MVSGPRRSKGVPTGPLAASEHEPQVFLSIILAWQRGAPILLKTRSCWTRDSTCLRTVSQETRKWTRKRFQRLQDRFVVIDWTPSLFADYRLRSFGTSTPTWGHLADQTESPKKITGVDDSAIPTSTAIRGLKIVSEGTNCCRQQCRKCAATKTWSETQAEGGGIFCWTPRSPILPDEGVDGSETESQDCEKGASSWNRGRHHWLIARLGSRDRNSMVPRPTEIEERV